MDILSANDYINSFCVDTEEWLENASDEQKVRCLNVAERTLKREFKQVDTTGAIIPFELPDEAIYEFANVLSILFSDTNKLALQGLNTLTINGLGTFDFGSNTVKSAGEVRYSDYIPQISRDLINEANGNLTTNRRIKWTKV